MRIANQPHWKVFVLIMVGLLSTIACSADTNRIYQIDNTRVKTWKTIIYPTKKAQLTLHRHDNDRVVVALTNGLLKVTNDKGQVHNLKLKKGMSYFLPKDPKGEMHVDENMTKHLVSVVVIELK